ncbi:hypothetical protein BDN70DRAFT_592290 [Pholiota conissans]|uniref:Uncharacterized protein n=1 Tax=Pholiota conissans TaxID=109636 RepID=A0A9P5ZF77_9AGAR|nr:hypothetical protein BDN70DRAFT_592290 [Pholiota conissans]
MLAQSQWPKLRNVSFKILAFGGKEPSVFAALNKDLRNLPQVYFQWVSTNSKLTFSFEFDISRARA